MSVIGCLSLSFFLFLPSRLLYISKIVNYVVHYVDLRRKLDMHTCNVKPRKKSLKIPFYAFHTQMYPLTFDTSIVIFRFFYDERIMAITDILITINKNRYPYRIVSDEVSFNNNTMGVTSGTVTDNSSRAPGFIPGS